MTGAPNQQNPVYNAVQSGPHLGWLDERGVQEFLPGFNGMQYLTWGLFVIWIVSTIYLTLYFDAVFFRKVGITR